MKPIDYYKFTCEAGDEPTSAELLIFDAIGNWEEIGEISAKAFAKDLAALPKSVKRIDLHINSPGGSLFDASAIYSRLADHPSQKMVYIDGLAASAASIVAMVGHKIFMRANATLMMHLPSGLAIGNADDMRKMAGALDTITESMINIYAKRSSLPRDEIRNILAAESWFSPQQAVDKGFADEVRGVVKAAASLGEHKYSFDGRTFDLSRFKNVPAFTAQTVETKESKNTMEKPTVTATETPPQDPPPPKPAPGTGKPETGTEKPPPAQPPERAAAESDLDRGMRLERERVTALQKLDKPATHEIVMNAIKDGKQPSDILADCMDAMEKAVHQSDRRADAAPLNRVKGSDSGATGEGDPDDAGAKLTTAVQNILKARGQSQGVLNSRN